MKIRKHTSLLFYAFITVFLWVMPWLITSNAYAMSIPKDHVTLHHTQVSLQTSMPTLSPDHDNWLLLTWKMDPGWMIYGQNPGDGGLPPSFTWDLPKGVSIASITWPDAIDHSKDGLQIFGYKDTCWTRIKLKIGSDFKASPLDSIKVSIKWSVCSEQCMIAEAPLMIRFPSTSLFVLNDHLSLTSSGAHESSSPHLTGFIFLLLCAFIGGVLLNLMPCVLPVLSLKILDFTEMRSKQSSIRSIRLHALSFTAGILVTFQVLNLILIGLRHAGEHVGWGFQLQSPYFVAGLMILFIGLTLNLFGVFEIGLSTLRLGNTLNTDKHKTLVNSFSKGIIACVVATPCSAPFMGTALAAALNHSIGTSIIIFLFLGLGLSLPFLVVCVWPYSVHSFIPKPGPWMVTLKHGMGLFMLASVGWMIWILNTHMHLEYILTPVWCITCALWIYGRLQTLDNRSLKKNILIVLSIACATSAMYALHTGFDQTHTQDTSQWKPFSPEAVQKARDEGKSVLINFTARWCVTCQTNKKFILDSSDIRAHLKDHDVALFIADWTHHDPVITQTLKTFGHNSIPFIAYYKNGEKEPVLLPSILTKQRIYELIK